MSDNPRLEALKSAYTGWHETKGGNVDEIMELFDDHVEMHSALSADIPDAVAGVHLHKAQAGEYFEGLLRDWEMIYYHVDRFIVGEDGREIVAVCRCAWRNKQTGNVIDTPKIDIHTFNEDGRVVRFQEVYDTLGFARALGVV